MDIALSHFNISGPQCFCSARPLCMRIEFAWLCQDTARSQSTDDARPTRLSLAGCSTLHFKIDFGGIHCNVNMMFEGLIYGMIRSPTIGQITGRKRRVRSNYYSTGRSPAGV